MEARVTKLVTDSIKDLMKDATKNKEDLTKDATKNKEDLTKVATDMEGRLKNEISMVAISQARIIASTIDGATIIIGILAILRIPSSLVRSLMLSVTSFVKRASIFGMSSWLATIASLVLLISVKSCPDSKI